MKLFKILALSAIALFSYSCTEEDNYLSTDPADTGIFLKTISNNSTQFTPTSFNTSKIDLTLELSGNSAEERLSNVNLFITYKDSEKVFTGGEKLYKSYSLNEFSKNESTDRYRKNFVLTLSEIFSVLGISNTAVYGQADVITVRFEVVDKSGRKFTNTNLGLDMTTAYYNSPFRYSFTVFCPFNAADYNGNFEVLDDTWKDYAVGDLVPVVQGTTSNQIIIKATNNPYLVNSSTAQMIVTLNTTTGAITNVKSNEDFNYGGADIFTVSGSGSVDFCSKTITLSPLNFGSLSGFKFVIRKK